MSNFRKGLILFVGQIGFVIWLVSYVFDPALYKMIVAVICFVSSTVYAFSNVPTPAEPAPEPVRPGRYEEPTAFTTYDLFKLKYVYKHTRPKPRSMVRHRRCFGRLPRATFTNTINRYT